MNQDSNSSSIETLFKKTGDYVETKIDLLKLQAVDKTSEVTSSLVSNIVIGVLGMMMLIIFNIGIAFYLGEVLGRIYYGFFLVSAFYMLLTVLLYVFRKDWLKGPVQDQMIRKLLNSKLKLR